jgi:hypothetical protein
MSLAPRRDPLTPIEWAWRNRQWAAPESVIGEIAAGYLNSARLGDLSAARSVRSALYNCVPAGLADRCTPGPVRARRLTIWVDCPTSRYELQSRWTPALLRGFNEHIELGGIREIVFRLRTGGDA